MSENTNIFEMPMGLGSDDTENPFDSFLKGMETESTNEGTSPAASEEPESSEAIKETPALSDEPEESVPAPADMEEQPESDLSEESELAKTPALESDGKSEKESENEPANPLMDAMEEQDQKSIYEKPPVFKHGSAEEVIEDIDQTFEDLRAAKAGDFPELEDPKKVTWVVTYGKVTKTVTSADAAKKKIGEYKRSIEKSKDFTTALKKAKDKNPTCEIKPRIIAQSKGQKMPVYKGVFRDTQEAKDSGKFICLIPGSDGKVYEIRNEDMGQFITPAGTTEGLSEIRAGFTPALPLIPAKQLLEIMSFFRSFISEDGSFEAIVNILWDKQRELFITTVPTQKVSASRAESDISGLIDTSRFIHYMDIHSHNTMNAKFSEIDDRDEKATRLYAVIGCLDRYFPRIRVRMSNGGKFMEIDPELVFEPFQTAYPSEWDGKVTCCADSPRTLLGGAA